MTGSWWTSLGTRIAATVSSNSSSPYFVSDEMEDSSDDHDSIDEQEEHSAFFFSAAKNLNHVQPSSVPSPRRQIKPSPRANSTGSLNNVINHEDSKLRSTGTGVDDELSNPQNLSKSIASSDSNPSKFPSFISTDRPDDDSHLWSSSITPKPSLSSVSNGNRFYKWTRQHFVAFSLWCSSVWHIVVRNSFTPAAHWLQSRSTLTDRIFWKAYQELQMKHHTKERSTFWGDLIFLCRWQRHRIDMSTTYDRTWTIQSKKFWLFFLQRTKYMSISIFSFNILSSLFVIFLYLFWESDSTEPSSGWFPMEWRWSLVSNMLLWMLLSLFCWSFFVALTTVDSMSKNSFLPNLLFLWTSVGQCIVATRFVLLGYNIIYTWIFPLMMGRVEDSSSLSKTCFGLNSLPNERHVSFIFVVLHVAWDMYQLLILSFFPSPWPWILRMSWIECVSTLLRIVSCGPVLLNVSAETSITVAAESFAIHNYKKVIVCVSIAICAYYFIATALATLSFERSMRTAFNNFQRQRLSAREKRKVINMLCEEIKIPAQQLLRTLTVYQSSAKLDALSSRDRSPATKSCALPSLTVSLLSVHTFVQSTRTISTNLSTLIDDMLLLMKVEESRFEMYFHDKLIIRDVMREAARLTMDCLGLSFSTTDRFLQITILPMMLPSPTSTTTSGEPHVILRNVDMIYSKRNFLRAIVFHSLLALVSTSLPSGALLTKPVTAIPVLQRDKRGKLIPFLSMTIRILADKESKGEHRLDVQITANYSGHNPHDPLQAPSECVDVKPQAQSSPSPSSSTRSSHSNRVGLNGISESALISCEALAGSARSTWKWKDRRVRMSIPCALMDDFFGSVTAHHRFQDPQNFSKLPFQQYRHEFLHGNRISGMPILNHSLRGRSNSFNNLALPSTAYSNGSNTARSATRWSPVTSQPQSARSNSFSGRQSAPMTGSSTTSVATSSNPVDSSCASSLLNPPASAVAVVAVGITDATTPFNREYGPDHQSNSLPGEVDESHGHPEGDNGMHALSAHELIQVKDFLQRRVCLFLSHRALESIFLDVIDQLLMILKSKLSCSVMADGLKGDEYAIIEGQEEEEERDDVKVPLQSHSLSSNSTPRDDSDQIPDEDYDSSLASEYNDSSSTVSFQVSDIPFLSGLNMVDLKLYSLIFLQSVADCIEAREKKFRGTIVLMSERLSYLDHSECQWFDWGIPLPCEEGDIEALLNFLVETVRGEDVLRNSFAANSTKLSHLPAAISGSYPLAMHAIAAASAAGLLGTVGSDGIVQSGHGTMVGSAGPRVGQAVTSIRSVRSARSSENSVSLRNSFNQGNNIAGIVAGPLSMSNAFSGNDVEKINFNGSYANKTANTARTDSLPAQNPLLSPLASTTVDETREDLMFAVLSIDSISQSIRSISSAAFEPLKKFVNPLRYLLNFLMAPLFISYRESYAKWRTLPPLQGFLHHTMCLDALGGVLFVLVLVECCLGAISIEHCVFQMAVVFLFYMRSFVYFRVLQPRGFPLLSYCVLVAVVTFSFLVYGSLFEFLHIRSSINHSVTSNEDSSLTQTFSRSKNGISGMEPLLLLVNFPLSMRFHTDMLVYPLGWCSTLLIMLQASFSLEFHFGRFFRQGVDITAEVNPEGRLMLLTLQLFIFFYGITTAMYHYFSELANAEAFGSLFELLLSQDSFDRILFLGKISLSLPLQQLQDVQNSFLSEVKVQAKNHHMLITPTLHSDMCNIQLTMMMSKEFLMHLRIGEAAFFQQSASVFFTAMKATLVKTLVRDVVNNFLPQTLSVDTLHALRCSLPLELSHMISLSIPAAQSSVDSTTNIRFHFKIDPSLLLVRLDGDLLSALLSYLCRQSIKRIEKSQLLNRNNSVSSPRDHEILIWIHLPTDDEIGVDCGPYGNNYRNATKSQDVHTMIITILDTSDTQDDLEARMLRVELENVLQNIGSTRRHHRHNCRLYNDYKRSYLETMIGAGSLHKTESLALCDRFMSFFQLQTRYRSGVLSPSGGGVDGMSSCCNAAYRYYQQAGIPFLYCSDSRKIATLCERFICHEDIVQLRRQQLDFFLQYIRTFAQHWEGTTLRLLEESVAQEDSNAPSTPKGEEKKSSEPESSKKRLRRDKLKLDLSSSKSAKDKSKVTSIESAVISPLPVSGTKECPPSQHTDAMDACGKVHSPNGESGTSSSPNASQTAPMLGPSSRPSSFRKTLSVSATESRLKKTPSQRQRIKREVKGIITIILNDQSSFWNHWQSAQRLFADHDWAMTIACPSTLSEIVELAMKSHCLLFDSEFVLTVASPSLPLFSVRHQTPKAGSSHDSKHSSWGSLSKTFSQFLFSEKPKRSSGFSLYNKTLPTSVLSRDGNAYAHAAHHFVQLRDMAHILRIHNFMGLIGACYAANLSPMSNAVTSSAQRNYRRTQLENVNIYSDAVKIDLHLQVPFTEESVSSMISSCENHLISLL